MTRVQWATPPISSKIRLVFMNHLASFVIWFILGFSQISAGICAAEVTIRYNLDQIHCICIDKKLIWHHLLTDTAYNKRWAVNETHLNINLSVKDDSKAKGGVAALDKFNGEGPKFTILIWFENIHSAW